MASGVVVRILAVVSDQLGGKWANCAVLVFASD